MFAVDEIDSLAYDSKHSQCIFKKRLYRTIIHIASYIIRFNRSQCSVKIILEYVIKNEETRFHNFALLISQESSLILANERNILLFCLNIIFRLIKSSIIRFKCSNVSI